MNSSGLRVVSDPYKSVSCSRTSQDDDLSAAFDCEFGQIPRILIQAITFLHPQRDHRPPFVNGSMGRIANSVIKVVHLHPSRNRIQSKPYSDSNSNSIYTFTALASRTHAPKPPSIQSAKAMPTKETGPSESEGIDETLVGNVDVDSRRQHQKLREDAQEVGEGHAGLALCLSVYH